MAICRSLAAISAVAGRYRNFAQLEDDLAQGSRMLLCGILIEPQASPVITADAKDPKFFAAIFENERMNAPQVEEVAEHQSCRTAADNANLRPNLFHYPESIAYCARSYTRCTTPAFGPREFSI